MIFLKIEEKWWILIAFQWVWPKGDDVIPDLLAVQSDHPWPRWSCYVFCIVYTLTNCMRELLWFWPAVLSISVNVLLSCYLRIGFPEELLLTFCTYSWPLNYVGVRGVTPTAENLHITFGSPQLNSLLLPRSLTGNSWLTYFMLFVLLTFLDCVPKFFNFL